MCNLKFDKCLSCTQTFFKKNINLYDNPVLIIIIPHLKEDMFCHKYVELFTDTLRAHKSDWQHWVSGWYHAVGGPHAYNVLIFVIRAVCMLGGDDFTLQGRT